MPIGTFQDPNCNPFRANYFINLINYHNILIINYLKINRSTRLHFHSRCLLLIESVLNTQFIRMEMENYMKEMEGKILLMENKKFLFSICFIGVYYVSYLCLLAHMILQAGGFH